MGEEGGRLLGIGHAHDLDESLSDHIFIIPLREGLIYRAFP